MLIAYVLLFIALSPGILFTARFGKKMGKVTVAALHALVFLIAVNLLDMTEAFQTTPFPFTFGRADVKGHAARDRLSRAMTTAGCSGNNGGKDHRGFYTYSIANEAFKKAVVMSPQDMAVEAKRIRANLDTCSGTTDENNLCQPFVCLPGPVDVCRSLKTYDANVTYKKGDQVEWLGSVLEFISATPLRQYYPGHHMGRAWKNIGPCLKTGVKTPTYDPKVTYKVGDIMYFNKQTGDPFKLGGTFQVPGYFRMKTQAPGPGYEPSTKVHERERGIYTNGSPYWVVATVF